MWMFAEGSRGGELFDNFFLLYNPLGSPVTAYVTYAMANGGIVRRAYAIPAGRRLTLAANEVPELAGQDFSVVVETATGIIAERSMYWRPVGSPQGTPWVGGHAALGSPGSFENWFFAEGAAGQGFETFYLLFNPHPTTVTVHANFFTESAGLIQRTYTVGPAKRETIYLNAEVGNVGGVAAFLSATSPFVAERSIYWGAGRVEGTSALGMTTTANVWELPEGAAGGNFETFLLLANPYDTASTVDISLQIEGFGQITLPPSMRKVVPHWGRLTLYMPTILREMEIAEGMPPGSLANKSFATTVRVFSGPPIVAEHAVYWQRAGSNFWRAGTAAFGTPR
jgi:hypothetical protein